MAYLMVNHILINHKVLYSVICIVTCSPEMYAVFSVLRIHLGYFEVNVFSNFGSN